MRPVYASIDLDAIRHNVSAVKASLPEKTRLLAVVKADAYGHGAVEVSRAALEAGASFLAVAIPEEGEAIRAGKITAPILVLSAVRPVSVPVLVDAGLIATVFEPHHADDLEAYCAPRDIVQSVHVKVDTGMGRIGVTDTASLSELLAHIAAKCPHVRVEGMFSHFACADMPEAEEFSQKQQERYFAFADVLKAACPNAMLHFANSAATLSGRCTELDMCRLGISMYGYPPDRGFTSPIALRPAMTFRGELTMVKTIDAGRTVSYGAKFKAEKPTRIATVPLGYGDGLHRCIWSAPGAYVLVNGKKAPYAGRVCMDQFMIDVTDIPDAKEGDEAVIFGYQNGELLSADDVASWAGTISYEVLLAVSARVPRVYVNK